jgi:phosphatidate cytidylyltransferase
MIITIATVLLGGNVLYSVVAAISLIGMMELYRTIKMHQELIGFVGYLSAAAYYLLLKFELEEYMLFYIIAFLLVLLLVYVFSFPKYKVEEVAIVFLGLFYVAIMLSFIYQVRMLEDGFLMVWLIFIGAWGSDTCAYLVGILIGKHKILPKLSPKKSLEGCIGGIAGAALLGLLYATIFRENIVGVKNPQVAFVVICAASSVISQLGDLAASAMKRNHDIKDYGKLIPGHGGILDRFDSIIFVAPVVYFLAQIL